MKNEAALKRKLQKCISAQDSDGAIEVAAVLYKRNLWSTLFLLCRNSVLTQDLIQDTLTKALNAMRKGSYHDNGMFLAWLSRIAYNEFVNHVRKKKKLPTLPLSTTYLENEEAVLLYKVPTHDLTWQMQQINTEISDQVRMLIDKLPREQRVVVIMRLYLGMSFKEIAEHTGLSINTAIGRMRYALINMRKVVEAKNLDLQGLRMAS